MQTITRKVFFVRQSFINQSHLETWI